MDKQISSYQQLLDLYQLMNMPEVAYEFEEEDGEWSVELIADGKVMLSSSMGFGETQKEALNDAADRFFNVVPTIDNVPIPKLLKLLQLLRNSTKDISDL